MQGAGSCTTVRPAIAVEQGQCGIPTTWDEYNMWHEFPIVIAKSDQGETTGLSDWNWDDRDDLRESKRRQNLKELDQHSAGW